MALGIGPGNLQHVVAAHARRQQRLVRVAEGRVREQERFLIADPPGKALRAECAELVTTACWNSEQWVVGSGR